MNPSSSFEYLTCLLHLEPQSVFPRSSISSSPVASFPVTRGTGRKVTKAATVSPTRLGVTPPLTPETSPALTLSPPRFPVPVPFPPQPQPTAVRPWARRGLHHSTAVSGTTVEPPQVSTDLCGYRSSMWWSCLDSEQPVNYFELLSISMLSALLIIIELSKSLLLCCMLLLFFFDFPFMLLCLPDSLVAGGKVVRSARVPMGGWAEEGQAATRHHEPVPEESSEDEMPPNIHKVNAVCVCLEWVVWWYLCVHLKWLNFLFFLFRTSGNITKLCEWASASLPQTSSYTSSSKLCLRTDHRIWQRWRCSQVASYHPYKQSTSEIIHTSSNGCHHWPSEETLG